MKSTIVLFLGVGIVLLSPRSTQADVLAGWTFESSGLGSSTPSFQPGANTVTTNFYAESGLQAGTAAAIGLHVGAATYTSPAGNGSVKSFSSQTWALGDYYQFSASSVGFANVQLSFDQVSSSSGPGKFTLAYSTDGSVFTDFGAEYTVLVNASPNTWGSGSSVSTTSYSYDLSSITALNDASTIYIRLVASSLVTAGGTTVTSFSTAGSSRVDNVSITADPVPEPSTLALAALGGLSCLFLVRKKH